MKEKTRGEWKVEKDKGLVYEASWRSSPKKWTKNRYVSGSRKRDEVYRERGYEMEMRVEDKKEMEGGNRG